MTDLDITGRDEGEFTVIRLVGDVDVSAAARLRDALARLITCPSERVLVDLTDVPFLDSTGLGVLVARLKQQRVDGGDMALVIPSERLLRNFRITGLDRVFRIYATVAQAVAADADGAPPADGH
ncbi:STAS domain-containing protein [Flexivirga caeni]|uniref:Anti-sigma factor antagonist n=1 Tax=Flexivirga caeni TaxID=2294115 RepID=A0A3M9LYE0_9MICO|nr:STAS domain-containing protein [Flexivirga caeni]RNI18316.1 anti-sigma factor antagonist [Flexivirga caeni]